MDTSFFQFQHPFTTMVVGPTSSGKTYLVRRLLKNHKLTCNFNVDKIKIFWCYGQWQSLYNENLENCDIEYIDGLPTFEELKEKQPHLIVIDDLMTELGSNKELTKLFTKGSHHLNISILFIVQNLYAPGSQMITINRNTHYYLFLKNPKGDQLPTFARTNFQIKAKGFMEAYRDATSKPFGYIKVDFTQKTPDKFRLQTRLTPEELPDNIKYYEFAPVYYELK